MSEVRKKLQLGFTALALVGIAGVIFILLQTMRPTESAVANRSYFEVDLATIPEGDARSFEWHEKPFWIIHLSQTQINSLSLDKEHLRFPQYLQESQSAREPDISGQASLSRFLVVSMLSNVSPCGVKFQQKAPREFQFAWHGGFVDRCSNAFFDLAGRVYSISHDDAKDLPALPYKISQSRIMVFVDQEE